MRHGACKAQGNRWTRQGALGFGAGNLAAKLKRHISHTRFTAHQTPTQSQTLRQALPQSCGAGPLLGPCAEHAWNVAAATLRRGSKRSRPKTAR